MITLTKNGYERSIDIEQIFYDNAEWLAHQATLPIRKYIKLIKKMAIREQDMDSFWKEIAVVRNTI